MGGYRLDGRNPLAYMGVKPSQPPQLLVRNSAPTANDVYNFVIGSLWVVQQKINPVVQAPQVWILVNKEQNQAVWIQLISGSSGVLLESLTGDSGGAVFPTSHNINIIGTSNISVVGNPGTSTLTIDTKGDIATSYPTQSGTAVPSAGALTINGSGVISTSGAGSTVTIAASGAVASSFITNPATGTATPSSGILTFAGAGGTVVSAAGSTVTITSTDNVITYTGVNHAASAYTVLAADDYISCDVTAGVISILLPNTTTTGRTLVIKDKVGLAATSNITVTTVGGAVNIDGATSFVMNTAYEAINVIWNGSSYEIY